MNNDFLSHLGQTISSAFLPSVHEHPAGLTAVAVFAGCNLALWVLTRGKEYVIGAAAAALFLIPFLKM